jgi:hypothetical protein
VIDFIVSWVVAYAGGAIFRVGLVASRILLGLVSGLAANLLSVIASGVVSVVI